MLQSSFKIVANHVLHVLSSIEHVLAIAIIVFDEETVVLAIGTVVEL